MDTVRLNASDLPTKWFNYLTVLPEPLPPIKNTDGKEQSEIMKSIRPKALVELDKSDNSWIDIPGEVLDKLIQVGRPTDLRRAKGIEKYLETPVKIFIKREDQLTTGSFKINSALAQAYYCKKEGFQKIITETGAGQWGMSVSLAAKMFNLDCDIYMAKCSYEQKPYRKYYMEVLNSNLFPSPNENSEFGKKLLAKNPTHPGSIGTAITDAIQATLNTKQRAAYLSGSNVSHVIIHQSIIGLEIKKQMQIIGEEPDEIIACVSGGGNLGGAIFPYLKSKLSGNKITFTGVESSAAPRLTQGIYDYDRSDLAGFTPLVKSYTMGSDFIPAPVHVGGLRQHNGSPSIGLIRNLGLLEAEAYTEQEAFEAAKLFLTIEGILIAPESAHAVASTIKSALKAKEQGKSKNIVCVLSGNGFLDLQGFNEVLIK